MTLSFLNNTIPIGVQVKGRVITQLSAARTAIERAIGVVVSSYLVECVHNAEEIGEKNIEELVKEAVNLLVSSRYKKGLTLSFINNTIPVGVQVKGKSEKERRR